MVFVVYPAIIWVAALRQRQTMAKGEIATVESGMQMKVKTYPW